MKILYTSLFPRMPFEHHEEENLTYFERSIKYYNLEDIFIFNLATAHKETFEDSDHNCLLTGFKYNKKMNEERAHEIAYSKEKLFEYSTRRVIDENIDYLFYIDSDIQIDSKEIVELCKVLKYKENSFVTIPYVLRDIKGISPKSFGCYIIPYSIIKYHPYLYECLYRIEIQKGLLYRIGAPDCNLRDELLRIGYNEIVAYSANTKHYLNNENYLEYDSGKIREI